MSYDINNNFMSHDLDSGQKEICRAIREHARSFAFLIEQNCPDSREKSLAMTKLEETMFWANASVARNLSTDDEEMSGESNKLSNENLDELNEQLIKLEKDSPILRGEDAERFKNCVSKNKKPKVVICDTTDIVNEFSKKMESIGIDITTKYVPLDEENLDKVIPFISANTLPDYGTENEEE